MLCWSSPPRCNANSLTSPSHHPITQSPVCPSINASTYRQIITAISDQFSRAIWGKAILVLSHGQLSAPPPGTTFESFAERRAELLRRAVRRPFSRPELPAAVVENSETCKRDAQRRRVLPDGSVWVDGLVGLVSAAAASGKPYVWRPRLARRPNSGLKWLIPVVAYAQYMAWRLVLEPHLKKDEDRQASVDDEVWREKAAERRRLGIGPPLRPSAENAWRLEQMYDDD